MLHLYWTSRKPYVAGRLKLFPLHGRKNRPFGLPLTHTQMGKHASMLTIHYLGRLAAFYEDLVPL